ncbi:MAG: PhnD/SsuA/transferrin family substrate-binding protein [Gammaproteobacteria bacterium]|nr:PhnD/SsuA/transferrin family substrate-binding protein [Gammaproteobacteria bacterium]
MTKLLRVGGVPEHFNLPWRLAIDDDAFAGTGAAVDYSDFPAGTGELTRALRDNELDIALVLTEGAVADILQHDKNRLVKMYVSSPLTWGIHVAATSDIRRVADIRGRRVAISRYGSGSHLIAIVDAATRGWPTDDMRFVVIDNLDGARKALASGRADVFLWERHMTQPLVDSGEFRRVGQREVPWPAFAVSVRREILRSHASQIRAVLDVVSRYASNLKRRKTAPSLIAETYGIRLADAEKWLAAVRWGGSYRRPTAALARVFTALEAQKVIAPGHHDADDVWHRL